MKEIKVGDFIRTNSGTIAKLKRIEFDKVDKDLKWYFYDKKEPEINIVKEWCINKPYIEKYSPNLIDLIEEGDYVNGYKVVKANLEDNEHEKFVDIYCPSINLKLQFLEHIYAERIQSIVTKEQFNQMKYIVGDESNE